MSTHRKALTTRERKSVDESRRVNFIKREVRKAERESGTGGTGATILKMVRNPVQRLIEGGKIGPAEVQAAADIERAFLALSGALMLRPQNMDRVDGQGRSSDWPASVVDCVERYCTWANYWSGMARMGSPCLQVAIALVIDQRGFRDVEDDCRLRNGKAPKVLAAMLRDYAARAGWCDTKLAWRWMDEAKSLFRAKHPDLRLAELAGSP